MLWVPVGETPEPGGGEPASSAVSATRGARSTSSPGARGRCSSGDNDCTHSGRPSASPKKVMTATTASAAHAPGAKRGATPNSAVDTPTSTSRAGTVTSAAPSMRGTSPASVVMTRSEEHTSELQSLMRISYDVFCLKKKNN